MIRRFYQKHEEAFEKFDLVILNNPVWERGLILAPIIVTCNTLSNAFALSAAFSIITVLSVFFTAFIPKSFPYTIRVILNALTASLAYIPAVLVLDRCFPGSVFNLGIYLPLLVTNSLIVQKSESRFHKEKKPVMLVQLLMASIGFALTACTTGMIREILGKGTLLGRPLKLSFSPASAASLPFFGFILVGFLAALVKRWRLYLHKSSQKKEEK